MAEAFTWGAGGEQETSSSRARRRLAEALMMEGGSTAPIQSPWQGLDRVAKALMGGYESGQLDREDKTRDQEATALMQQHPAFGGMGAAASPVAAASPMGTSVAMPTVASRNVSPGRIYSENELSPLDPPSGQNRDLAIRTIVGEAADQGPLGMQAVGNVIRNRAVNGGYGGDTPAGVVLAPNQFEPWNGGAAKQRMLALQPTDPRYQQAGTALDRAYTGDDPTNGAVNFIQPSLQTAMGRSMPAWAQAPGQMIGDHKFIGGAAPNGQPFQMANADGSVLPPNAQEAQGYVIPGQGATTTRAAPTGPQMPPAVAQWVQKAIRNPATRASAVAVLGQYSKPKETYGEETDAQGNVWSVNQQTGQRTVSLKHDKPPEEPTTVREYKFYKENLPPGQQAMPYDQWSTAKARAAATNVTTNVGGGSDKQIYDTFDERAKEARATATGLVGLRTAREALQGVGGSITGAGADGRLYLSKIGAYLGVTDPAAIQNTETFRAAIAPQVSAVLKSTVGTANISNSDRSFAEKAAGGSIELDKGSITRLLDIMERASIARLQDHQEQLDAVFPDPEKHKRERALFGIKVPTKDAPPAGATKSGIKWSVE